MLENPTLPENPVENTTQAVRDGGEPVPDGLKGEQQGEEGDRNTGANRWPREETMALLKIRSDMDAAFRDISPKAPLWEQVSRKLAELGYDRSAKKCKEKFENIHKYYRRTKEGRSGRPNGKTYRFFEQLEALNPHPIPSSEGLPPIAAATTTITNVIPNNNKNNNSSSNVVHVIQDAVPCSIRFPSNVAEYHSTSSATTSSSSKGSGEEGKKNKKKRRLTEFFEGLMREVIEKQETLQRKFMEVLEKCEQDRMAREQAWKTEELARIKRERELLAQERSIAAAKDEAVLAFLNKFAENNGTMLHLPEKTQVPIIPHDKDKEKDKGMQQDVNNGGSVVDVDKDKDKHQECGNVISVGNFVHMSSSRWPKDEVEALIRLRTQLDVQQQQQPGNNGGSNKGPLWEEVSSAMKGLGYDRSAKRCKEKWENINKYFKRMKEKNKRKPEDSKTCPYYHHLEALYSKKPKNNNNKVDESGGSGNELKPEELLMHIMSSSGQDQEERQQQQQQQIESSSEDADREDNRDKNLHEGGDNEDGYHQMVENSPSIAIMG